jgi:hypothetical protein
MDLPPITHLPHTITVIYAHDSAQVLVAMAMCDEGRCIHQLNHLAARYRAAGMQAEDFPPHPSLQFWEDQEVLRTMANLKLAQHEGRTKAIQWAKARLVELASGK